VTQQVPVQVRELVGPAVGLTSVEAAARLRRDGPNILPDAPPLPAWRLLLRQMVHFFALLLWVAGGLALVAGMPQLGAAIFGVVVINGCFAFAQEYRAERAASRLRDLLPARVKVVRDGDVREVDAPELVAGDLVVLEAGDRISADLALVEGRSLSVDESTLTGESIPVSPQDGERLYAGTFVVTGDARAVVDRTGNATRLAEIARLTRSGTRPAGPLAAELTRVVHIIAVISVGVGVVFFGIALALGTAPKDGFLFAIGVTVALVPEGLLPTVTLSLSVGAQRMAARNALVRRLESVETLGSTTFVCTDKTGTLTSNQMAVVEVWTPNGTAHVTGRGYDPSATIDAAPAVAARVVDIAAAGRRASTGRAVERDGAWRAQGDPMEAAIDVLARRVGVPEPDAADAPGLRFPFDPRRRRESVVIGDAVYTKGAPDAVVPLSDGGAEADRALHAMASRGLRVLAVATGRLVANAPRDSAAAVERDLELVGLLGIEDPPRSGVDAAIAACRRSGIRVAMITGDHPATALAIAREVGLVRGDTRVVVGADLPADEEALGALVDHDGVVLARVEPEDKLRIARALRARGHVVAMTGDGVNDGPALQQADIGIAMGRTGTDVAREAADLVLLDDHFATIVGAVEQGRATYANMRRFLTYHLTDNVAELTPFVLWALSAGRIPLALGVLQVLSLDIVTDIFPSLALGAEPPSAYALDGPPPTRHLLDRGVLSRAFGVLGPTEALVEMAAFLTVLVASGWAIGHHVHHSVLAAASGAAFAAVVLGQSANAFACRSATQPVGRVRERRNRLLWIAVAVQLAIAAVLFTPPLAHLLQQAVPPAAGAAVAACAVPAVIGVDAIQKRVVRGTLRRTRRP
jgi:magnesium-transporting ATPase (P-type)